MFYNWSGNSDKSGVVSVMSSAESAKNSRNRKRELFYQLPFVISGSAVLVVVIALILIILIISLVLIILIISLVLVVLLIVLVVALILIVIHDRHLLVRIVGIVCATRGILIHANLRDKEERIRCFSFKTESFTPWKHLSHFRRIC